MKVLGHSGCLGGLRQAVVYLLHSPGQGIRHSTGIADRCLPPPPGHPGRTGGNSPRSLPEQELEAIHDVTTLPDYTEGDLYWNGVIALYRAGILMGNDDAGTFRPDSQIRRSELAAILSRLVRPEYRIPADPSAPEPSEPDTGMDAFALPESMPELPFPDVSTDAWHYPYIQAVYAMDLMQGVGDDRFSPMEPWR